MQGFLTTVVFLGRREVPQLKQTSHSVVKGVEEMIAVNGGKESSGGDFKIR